MDVSKYNEDIRNKITALENYKNENYEATLRIASEIMRVASRREDKGLKGLCNYYVARYYFNLKNCSETIRYLEKSITDCSEGNAWSEYCHGLNLMAVVMVRQGNLANAMQVFSNAAVSAEKYDVPQITVKSYMDLAEICYQIGAYSDAIKYELTADKNFFKIMRFDYFPHYYARHLALQIKLHIKLGDTTNAGDMISQLDKFVQDNSHANLEPYPSISHVLWGKYSGNHKWDELYMERLNSFFRAKGFVGEYQWEYFYLLELMSKDAFYEDDFRILLTRMDNFLEFTDIHGYKLRMSDIKASYYEHKGNEEKLTNELKQYREIHRNVEISTNNIMSVLVHSQTMSSMDLDMNKLLDQRSTMDELTGLPNRKRYNDYADRFFEACRGDNTNLGVAMISIDDVKKINDMYGYTIGDSCLVAVADALRKVSDDRVFVARYVGAEFVALFKGFDDEDILSKIREMNSNVLLQISQRDLPEFTLSEGICTHIPRALNKIWDYTSVADLALLKAMQLGYGQTLLVHHTSEISTVKSLILGQNGRLNDKDT